MSTQTDPYLLPCPCCESDVTYGSVLDISCDHSYSRVCTVASTPCKASEVREICLNLQVYTCSYEQIYQFLRVLLYFQEPVYSNCELTAISGDECSDICESYEVQKISTIKKHIISTSGEVSHLFYVIDLFTLRVAKENLAASTSHPLQSHLHTLMRNWRNQILSGSISIWCSRVALTSYCRDVYSAVQW